jgi:glycyl-tRNA synthetase beta chain
MARAMKKSISKTVKKSVKKAVKTVVPAKKPAFRDLLIEIGTEEIPAGYLPPALAQLRELAEKELSGLRLAHGKVASFATPRRLVLLVAAVADRQQESVRQVMGPARSVAFGPDGKPTRAAEGFARGQGVEVDSLTVVATPKGEYVAAVRREQSLPASRILPEALARLVTSLHFPKFQRWGSSTLRFARPIRWLVALHGKDVVELELEGLSAGRLTRGHRFLAPGPFAVKDAADFFRVMKRARVVVDQRERAELIRAGVLKAAKKLGGKPVDDEELLGVVANLVEYPVVLAGSFDRKYLALPREVLVTSMRSHQKYFAVVDGKGDLLPCFITVANNLARDGSVVVRGNERVLRARLDDAMFFFTEDRKVPLAERAQQLKAVVFQEKLGTSWEKMERFAALASRLAGRFAPGTGEETDQVARLCKADLVSQMVGEFPELQGVMGREYARAQGLPAAVAEGIADHYLPRGSGGETPRTTPGALVGLADRLDTVCGCFAIGITPSGAADPYALRRHALAIIAILLDRGWKTSLARMFGWSLDLLARKVAFDRPAVEAALADFFRGRLHNLLAGQGHRQDLVSAVLETVADDPVDASARVEALTAFAGKSGFADLMISVKRVMNIIPAGFSGQVDPGLLTEAVERDLLEAEGRTGREAHELVDRGEYAAALGALAALKAPVDAFFEGVLVMDKDERVRANRLGILSSAAATFGRFADFRKVQTDQA